MITAACDSMRLEHSLAVPSANAFAGRPWWHAQAPPRFRCLAVLLLFSVLPPDGQLPAAAAADAVIVAPLPWQVVQRSGFDPRRAAADPASRGEARLRVELTGEHLLTAGTRCESRLVAVSMGPDPIRAPAPAPAAAMSAAAAAWTRLSLEAEETGSHDRAAGSLVVPAGGWYRLEVRLHPADGGPSAATAVEPVGVGEVFLVAGQSYATNTNDERLSVTDGRRRVAAFDVDAGRWRLADDPQPAPDRSDGGSIWPPVGDRLAAALDVPVGFVNVAVGATSTRNWAPDGPLSARLQRAGQMAGPFRAVLWQQGESDVIEQTATDEYVARLQAIRAAAIEAWAFDPIWLCAFSTHHPTVYRDPDGEGRIRTAIERVSRLPGFGSGPDTDTLQGADRGGPGSRRHFSPQGQRRAAALWSDVLLGHGLLGP